MAAKASTAKRKAYISNNAYVDGITININNGVMRGAQRRHKRKSAAKISASRHGHVFISENSGGIDTSVGGGEL